MPRQKLGIQISFTAPESIYNRIMDRVEANHRSIAKEMRAILREFFKLPDDHQSYR